MKLHNKVTVHYGKTMSEPMTDERLAHLKRMVNVNLHPFKVATLRECLDEIDWLREENRLQREELLRKHTLQDRENDNERLRQVAVDFEAEAQVYKIKNGKLRKVADAAKSCVKRDEEGFVGFDQLVEPDMIDRLNVLAKALRDLDEQTND